MATGKLSTMDYWRAANTVLGLERNIISSRKQEWWIAVDFSDVEQRVLAHIQGKSTPKSKEELYCLLYGGTLPMNKSYNKTLALSDACHPLILAGIHKNEPQLCRVGDSEDEMDTIAHVVWNIKDDSDEFTHCAVNIDNEMDAWRFAIPVKVVRKPKPFSEILLLLTKEGYRCSKFGHWVMPRTDTDHPAFITDMLKCCEVGDCGSFQWRDEWVTEEYEDITD